MYFAASNCAPLETRQKLRIFSSFQLLAALFRWVFSSPKKILSFPNSKRSSGELSLYDFGNKFEQIDRDAESFALVWSKMGILLAKILHMYVKSMQVVRVLRACNNLNLLTFPLHEFSLLSASNRQLNLELRILIGKNDQSIQNNDD